MPSITRLLCVAPALLSVVYGQGQIISAQGTKGSPASLGLQIDLKKNDANIINTKEITDNVVNECGRTLLGGNIDIGENTEDQIGNKTITSVTKGSTVNVQIAQVNSDGAGPYSCDIDEASNIQGASGQTNLTVKETTSGGNINLAVTMPSNMTCIGASTGNVCTIRCFNQAAAGPFGGCFSVQQTDVTPNVNTPENIATAQTLAGVQAQVLQNQKDLQTALKSNAEAPTQGDQGVEAVDLLLNTDSVAAATAVASAKSTTAATASGKKGKGNGAATAATGGKAKGAAGANAKGAAGANAKANNKMRREFVA